ncbi:MAG: hypothetical protein AAF321_03965 [Pseudomonadota bacterium]
MREPGDTASPNARDAAEARRAREAREALHGAEQGEIAGSSAFARAANHMRAKDADADDPIEVWGTRIGRGLALLFALALVVWLVGHLTR